MNVVLTLTTIPTRLSNVDADGIRSCVASLTNQTFEEYEIHFNIPEVCLNTDERYELPEWILDYDPRLKIFRTRDLGSITKLVPTLERVSDPETIIILCDDDLVYDRKMVEEQVQNQSRFFGAAVGYDGMRVKEPVFHDPRDHYFTSHRCNAEVYILQGYKTVSFRREYFGQNFFDDFVGRSWSDDLVISAYLASKQIPRIVTYHESDPVLDSLEDWQQRGGVETFPVIRHTVHEQWEGCNLYRHEGVDENDPWLWEHLDRN
ncbi:MAG: glycosyltransferase [Pseudomonadota bacterium]